MRIKVSLAILAILLIAVAMAFLNPRPYKVGMSAEDVHLKMVHPMVVKQMKHKGRKFSRISSGSSAGRLEVWIDYYVWQKKPLFTHWYTCALDTNGIIVKVESDWDWRGFP